MGTKKPNKLAEAFNRTTTSETLSALQTKESSKSTSRVGRKTAIAYIDPAGARELKILSADTNRSQQDLFVEAINDLLVKHGRKPLA
jgi:hypothetical protein